MGFFCIKMLKNGLFLTLKGPILCKKVSGVDWANKIHIKVVQFPRYWPFQVKKWLKNGVIWLIFNIYTDIKAILRKFNHYIFKKNKLVTLQHVKHIKKVKHLLKVFFHIHDSEPCLRTSAIAIILHYIPESLTSSDSETCFFHF